MPESTRDMAVIDYIPSEADNADHPICEVIAAWHGADHPKLVIAHIDIGEAEDYRTYWQPGWGIENPEWIAGHDPDDWEGNFPVAVPSIAMAASTITSSAAMASE